MAIQGKFLNNTVFLELSIFEKLTLADGILWPNIIIKANLFIALLCVKMSYATRAYELQIPLKTIALCLCPAPAYVDS
jgi:hypothetical protein